MEIRDFDQHLESTLAIVRLAVKNGTLTFVPRERLITSLAYLEMCPSEAEKVLSRLTSDDFLCVRGQATYNDDSDKVCSGLHFHWECEGIWSFSVTCPCGEVIVDLELWHTNSGWRVNCRCFEIGDEQGESIPVTRI